MTAQIRPNRLAISDRFPMLGFSILSQGNEPLRAEITLATDPALFTTKENRSADNFFSTSSQGALTVEGSQASYVVPTEVLARFIGAERLYFALASGPKDGGALQVNVLPTIDSPYISLADLTGRSLRRVRMFPSRTGNGQDYGQVENQFTWAGDASEPGMSSQGQNPGSAETHLPDVDVNLDPSTNQSTSPHPSAPLDDYDDGFGPMPDSPSAETQAYSPWSQAQESISDNPTTEETERWLNRQAEDRVFAERRARLADFLPVRGIENVDDAFKLKALEVADALSLDVNHLMAVMSFETGGSFSPSQRNAAGSGATGLIQFMPATARQLNTTTDALAAMTAVEQLDYVQRYFEPFANRLNSVQDIYMAVLWPRAVGKPASYVLWRSGTRAYEQNRGLDRNGDNTVTAGEAASRVTDILQSAQQAQASTQSLAHALENETVTLGERQSIQSPNAEELGSIRSTAIQLALAANPALTAFVVMARTAAETGDVAVGIGPAVSGGIGAGGQLGAGVIFAPGNTMGIYGSYGAIVGAIASISLTVQVTVVDGGIENFNGVSMAAGFSVGEGVVGGGSALFDSHGNFIGISVQIGVGVGFSPLEVFASVQRGVATSMGHAVAFGNSAPAWAMIIGPEDVQQAQRYAPAWLDLYNWRVPSSVERAVNSRGFSVMAIGDAHGALNLDKYEVNCTRLPRGYTAEQLLNEFRLNINNFVDTDNTEFLPYDSSDTSKWRSSSPEGACFYLDIIGPDNAAVVGSMVESSRFRFTTIETPRSGDHPVSGHREFGFRTEGSTVIFYTRGADRSTQGLGETIVFAGADHLWKSFQRKMAAFINNHGGAASVLTPFAERFHPDVVRILYGSSSAQSLSFNESFTINWDEVQLVNQPTNVSCWAAAGAMVIGWRDRMSLSPQTIAEIAGRTTATGLSPDDVGQFASDLGLIAEPPMSWTQEGFRALLEENGPLWVAVAVPGLHAIVVTGLYNDGPNLFVRVSDPWDRNVGTPGSPGAYANTHATGSRYILTWEDFVAEYELPAHAGRIFLQIVHSDGNGGRVPNRGGQTPPGYAMSAQVDAKPSSAQPVLNDQLVANQPIDSQGHHGNVAMPEVIQITLAPETVAAVPPLLRPMQPESEQNLTWDSLSQEFDVNQAPALSGLPQLAANRGWTIGVSREGANGAIGTGVGVGPSGALFRFGPPHSVTEGDGHMVESNGLMVTVIEGELTAFTQWQKARAFTAVNGVTGAILFSPENIPMGAVMRFASANALVQNIEAMTQALQASQGGVPSTANTPVETNAPLVPPVSASALTNPTESIQPLVSIPLPFPPPGVEIFRSDVEANGVQYSLFLMDGAVSPQIPPAIATDLIPAEQVVLEAWPFIEGPSGKSFGGVAIDWSYGGGSVANVRLTPKGGAALDGWQVRVTTDIEPGPSTPTETQLKVMITTTFEREGEDSQSGLTEVILTGSGQRDVQYREAPAMSPAAA